jgi:hypothetical protein
MIKTIEPNVLYGKQQVKLNNMSFNMGEAGGVADDVQDALAYKIGNFLKLAGNATTEKPNKNMIGFESALGRAGFLISIDKNKHLVTITDTQKNQTFKYQDAGVLGKVDDADTLTISNVKNLDEFEDAMTRIGASLPESFADTTYHN